MSGLGIQYPPPTEDVPIFDPLVFLEAVSVDTGGGGGGGSYLNFPFAQGKETMADMDVTGLGAFFSGITMTGALNENFTNNQNIIMNGATSTYIQFPDGTRQSTAPIGLVPSGVTPGSYTNTNLTVTANGIITSATNGIVPIPATPTGVTAGSYTYTGLTVNTYGQITSATSGTAPIPATPTITAGTTNFTANGAVTYNQYGQITSATSGVIPSFVGGSFTNPNVTVNTYGQITSITNGTGTLLQPPTYILNNITDPVSGVFPLPPANAKTCRIVMLSAGGIQYPDDTTTYPGTFTPGLPGSGGSYFEFVFKCKGWSNYSGPLIGYNNFAQNQPFSGIGFGNTSPQMFWTPLAVTLFGGTGGSITITQTTNLPFSKYAQDGPDGSVVNYIAVTGNAYAFAAPGVMVNTPATNQMGTFNSQAGQEWVYIDYPYFDPATVNLTVTGTTNIVVEADDDSIVLGNMCRGAGAIYTPGPPPVGTKTSIPPGPGGWAIYYYG